MAARTVFGIVGWSGSGKTTLMRCLLPELVARGISVSTIKHAHDGFEIDKPGKDSHVHRAAGAREVLVSSAARFALIHEHRGDPEPSLEALMAMMAPVDLVLVEGFKTEPHDKLEVYRPGLGKPALHPVDRHVVAVASDEPLPGAGVAVLDLDDPVAIAEFVIAHCGIAAKAAGAA